VYFVAKEIGAAVAPRGRFQTLKPLVEFDSADLDHLNYRESLLFKEALVLLDEYRFTAMVNHFVS